MRQKRNIGRRNGRNATRVNQIRSKKDAAIVWGVIGLRIADDVKFALGNINMGSRKSGASRGSVLIMGIGVRGRIPVRISR